VEGALLLAWIERSVRPIDDITSEVMAYVSQRIR